MIREVGGGRGERRGGRETFSRSIQILFVDREVPYLLDCSKSLCHPLRKYS